jgi:exo-beta-1,3-glucanase (GH17 family)
LDLLSRRSNLTAADVKRAIVTEVVYITETAAPVVVYVDQDGVPYSTSIPGKTSSTAVVVESSASEAASRTAKLSSAPTVTPSSASPAPEVPIPSPTPTPSSVKPEAKPTVVETPTAEPTTLESTTLDPVSVEATTEEPVTSERAVSSVAVEPSSVTSPPPPAPTTQEPEPEQPSSPSAVPTTQAAEPVSSAPADPPAPPSATAPAPSAAVVPVQAEYNGGLPVGITYDPFAGSQDNSRCKTDQEIADEFAKMRDYKVVRIYGMGCNIIPLAVKNAVKNGQQLMIGAYMSNKGNGEDLSQVIKTLKSALDQYADGNWGLVRLFSVENERVNDHDMAASEVVDAINRARGQLRGLGYNGPVGAVDTVPATVDNPAICKASDVVMVNCHAFFDPNTEASNAGKFVRSQLEQVKSACGTDRVVVTETGWPHEGSANGKAIPSVKNQRAALASIRSEFSSDVFIFNAFDSPWKSDWASSFNAERWWGVLQ